MRLRVRALVAGVALVAALCATGAQANSIRFFGNGANQVDRIKIRIDDPSTSTEPPRPADVGLDFTIEFWVKGSTADNPGSIRCGSGTYGWIDGNAIFDRDRHSQQRAFGISVSGQGRIAFGATNTNGVATICGTRNVLDGNWHHVAVTRTQTGTMRLFVDGVQDASTTAGPTGDLSYPDDGVPENRCGGPCTASDPFIVLGAEKHDAFPGQLAYDGLMDELRISNIVRYAGNFTPPTSPFSPDGNTAALYHFDQASSGSCTSGTVIVDSATNPLSPGECFFGGSPGGPQWSADTPFSTSGSGTLQFSAATYAVSEEAAAGNVTITVTRTGGSDGAVMVNYATAAGTAIENADYGATSGTLSWNSGESASRTFTIPITNDTLVDSGETFTVTLTNASGGATLGTPSTATVTISDNDAPGTLQFTAANVAAAEGDGTISLQVSRTGGTSGTASIRCTTSNGTAIEPGDYTAIPAPGLLLSWADGQGGNRACPVVIVDDVVDEPGAPETFQAALIQVSGAELGAQATATISITDNDVSGSLQFSASDYAANEEGAGTVTITVRRTGGSDGEVAVNYASANGNALAGSDYTAVTGTLNWAHGDAADKSFTVPIANDTLIDSGETFTVTLSGATGGATIGTPSTATVTISDTDTAGTLQFTTASLAVVEGVGLAVLQVSRTGGTSGAASIRCTTSNGTAIAPADYTAIPAPGLLLSWADGEGGNKPCSVTIGDDVVDEIGAAETFQVSLSQASGAAPGAVTSATVSIQDDDPTTGALQFQTNGFFVDEGGGTAVITVARVGGSESAVSVQYATTSTGSTATAGVDYTPTSGTLNWNDGDMTSRQFLVTIHQDTDVESNETVRLQLSNFVGAQPGNPTNTALTIFNDDFSPAGALQLGSATYSVGEGAVSATITVRRVGGNSGMASVTYQTSNGTAIAGADYSNTNGTLNWADGDGADKTFAIPITDDGLFEGAETLNVQLANATGAVIGAIGSATVTIDDNDVAQPGTLQLAQATLEVNEDAGTINIGVTRTGGTDGAVQVTVTAVSGTAVAGSDFAFQNTSVSWAAGESGMRTVAIQITNDSVQESAESFTVSLINASGEASIGTPSVTTVTIAANDNTSGSNDGDDGGGGALDWCTLLLGLLPLLRRLREPAL